LRNARQLRGVPGPYLDTWARLQCQRPFGASDQEWWQVIDDAGRFLDEWGESAVEFGWTPGDIFDVPIDSGKCGLIWFLDGDSVRSLEPDGAFMESGRVFDKLTHCTWEKSPPEWRRPMSAYVLVTGVLFRAPEQRTSKAGKPSWRAEGSRGGGGKYYMRL
jgi:hypothetical protein